MRRLAALLLLALLTGCLGIEFGVATPASPAAPAGPTPGGFVVTVESFALPTPEAPGGFSLDTTVIEATDDIPDGDVATVTNVIDGDTIDATLNGITYRVRYIGVDTPERDEPYYSEATAANRALVAGQQVILVRDVSETDEFGRLLRYVYRPDGTFVNAQLIANGYARLVTFPPDTAQAAYFQQLQREAREAERGLWGVNELRGAPAGCNICDRNAYNCGDFSTRAAAQACFDYCLRTTGLDVHRLDGGGDGLVCETLP